MGTYSCIGLSCALATNLSLKHRGKTHTKTIGIDESIELPLCNPRFYSSFQDFSCCSAHLSTCAHLLFPVKSSKLTTSLLRLVLYTTCKKQIQTDPNIMVWIISSLDLSVAFSAELDQMFEKQTENRKSFSRLQLVNC